MAKRELRFDVIENDLADVIREKTPAERIEMISAANRSARMLVAAGIRHQHPDWGPLQVHREVVRRMMAPDIRPHRPD